MTHRVIRSLILGGLALLALGSSSRAEDPFAPPKARIEPPNPVLRDVGFTQKPGAQVPLDLPLVDEAGRPIRFSDCLSGRPIILTLGYYNCPLLCDQVLESFVRVLKVVSFDVGRDFDIVTVSINPKETPDDARAKESAFLKFYGRPEAAEGWHFLTTDQASIERLTQTVGFRYSYSETTRQYAHPAGVLVLTPDGKVSRYIYGLSFPARDLNLALTEASQNKIGGIVEQALLLCYVYDPSTGRYSFAIMTVIRVLGTATFLALASFVFITVRRDWRRRRPVGLPRLGLADGPAGLSAAQRPASP